jgi:hypothetical protein
LLIKDAMEALVVGQAALCSSLHTPTSQALRGVQVLNISMVLKQLHILITVTAFDHFFFFKLL